MKILYEAIATEDIYDEDCKTQLARKYPDIPKGSIVNILEEDYYNWYGGPWTRVEWNGNLYWTSSKKLKKLNFSPL